MSVASHIRYRLPPEDLSVPAKAGLMLGNHDRMTLRIDNTSHHNYDSELSRCKPRTKYLGLLQASELLYRHLPREHTNLIDVVTQPPAFCMKYWVIIHLVICNNITTCPSPLHLCICREFISVTIRSTIRALASVLARSHRHTPFHEN